MATISSTSTRITISGEYKAFTSGSGNTTTVIQFSSGDAPASGDADRFLLWQNGSDTGDWEVRYIESATSTTVTVTDGGFSSTPGTGEPFVISSNLADVETAEPVACTSSGSSYSFNGRDIELASGAFLADVNKSLVMKGTSASSYAGTYPIANNCVLQFGRLIGGEANDSTETIEGCQLAIEIVNNNSLVFTTQGSVNTAGAVLNFYGCLVESFGNGFLPFIRSPGPMRLIGCICDGPMGGRLYSTASELVDTRFSGNTAGAIAWSLGGTFTRSIDNAFFFQGNTYIKAFQNFQGVFSNTKFADSNTNIINSAGAQSSLLFTFVDCTTFADGKITNTNGQYKQAKSINYTITDSAGVGLTGAQVAVYDNAGAIQDAIRTSASGAVAQIDAVFFDRPHGSTSTDKSPFDIRIRKYGYGYQDLQSSVSEPIKQEYRLPDNQVTVLSEAAAGALTDIAIDFASETLTITGTRSLSEIYDYTQSQMALSANMDEVEFFKSSDGNVFTLNDDWSFIVGTSGVISDGLGKTVVVGGTGKFCLTDPTSSIDDLIITGNLNIEALITPLSGFTVSGAVDFNTVGTYALDGVVISEVTNSSGGLVTLNLTNGATITTVTPPASGSTVVNNLVDINVTSVSEGTSIQVASVETIGTITDGDVLGEGLADSNGVLSFQINYETAFDPSGLDVVVRCRNQGFPSAAIAATSGGTVFTDETTANNSSTTNDINLLPATPSPSDAYYWGNAEKFNQMKINISQATSSGFATLVWEYWNGSSWTSLSNLSDGTNTYQNLGNNIVSWSTPSGWAKTSVDSLGPFYFIRARNTSAPSLGAQPLGRKVKLDVTRYLPFNQNNTITSSGLNVVATWIKDTISSF